MCLSQVNQGGQITVFSFVIKVLHTNHIVLSNIIISEKGISPFLLSSVKRY